MEINELFQRFSVALAIGLLIGLERGWQARSEPPGGRAAGLRTHALAGVLGGLWGAMATTVEGGAVALGIAFATFAAALTLFRYRETAHEGTFGVTTVVAAMLAFALGAYALIGNLQIAAALGVAVTVLLALKGALHAWLGRITWPELRSGLVLLAMTFVLLPILPDRTVDPLDAVNPFEIWLLTIMIAVISFAGYLAMRLAGERQGAVITGVAGGLASSTAVTLTMARLAREHAESSTPFLAGALLAGATMMARVLAVVAFINEQLVGRVAVPLVVAGGALVLGALYMLRRSPGVSNRPGAVTLDNPFELVTILKFGALLMVVSALGHVLTRAAGSAGAFALAAVSGIADVDAITLTMARLGGSSIGMDAAAGAILLAVGVNTIAKAVMG